MQQQRCHAGKGVCIVVLFSVGGLAKRHNLISCAFRSQYLNQIIILSSFQSLEKRVAMNVRNEIHHVFNN